jgi:nucleotide-binding universal stress UspA family protein
VYKKILVPLDGSKLAECTLDHVKTIATGCHVPEVVLLRVVEEPVLPYIEAAFLHDTKDKMEADAKKYLSKVADTLKKDGVAAKVAVVRGEAAHDILEYTKKNNVDLIIISTHGLSGAFRWVFGSVADRVVRHSPVPVLTIAPAGCRQ